MSKIVKRTLDFFELFERERIPLSLSAIARALDLPVSSCHDVLRAMAASGYVHQPGERGEYYPTLRLPRTAAEIARNDPFLIRAQIGMRDLKARYGYSFFLARVEGVTARYLLVVEAEGPWRFHIDPGAEVRALHATSAGKAVLGNLPEAEMERVLGGLSMEGFTPLTIRSHEVLRADIAESQARGWYVNREESVLTATTLSTLVHWGGEVFVLTMAGPTLEVAPRLEEIAEDLVIGARKLEATR